jgi:hypothetical protein
MTYSLDLNDYVNRPGKNTNFARGIPRRDCAAPDAPDAARVEGVSISEASEPPAPPPSYGNDYYSVETSGEEGAVCVVVAGSRLHQTVHDYLCTCGSPGTGCETPVVRDALRTLDEDEHWSHHHPTYLRHEWLCSDLRVFRLSEPPPDAHLRAVIAEHRATPADDRCIEDDDKLYAALGDGIKCDRRVGDKLAMLRNCERFITNRCEGGGWESYAELEARAKRLREVAETLRDGVSLSLASLAVMEKMATANPTLARLVRRSAESLTMLYELSGKELQLDERKTDANEGNGNQGDR